MPRYLGIDYGRRRIGLAISDPLGSLASPLATIPSTGDPADDARAIVAVADREDVEAFVVGLPINMDDSEGPQAKLSRNLAGCLRAESAGRPVELWDERLTTAAADALLDQTHLTSAKRKKHRDQIAALVILQGYLDARPGLDAD